MSPKIGKWFHSLVIAVAVANPSLPKHNTLYIFFNQSQFSYWPLTLDNFCSEHLKKKKKLIYFFSKHDAIFFVLVINKMSHSKWWIHVFTYYCVKMLCRVLFLAPKPTWWLTLTDGVRLPQPGVSVAGQVLSDHAAFGQNGDEDGEADGDGDNGHQELPVFRDLCFRCPSACKRERKTSISQKYYNNIMSYAPDVNVRPPCFIPILEHWFVGVVWIEFLCLLFHNGSMNSLT